MKAHQAVACTMIAVGGYLFSTAAALAVFALPLLSDKGFGLLLVIIALAAVACTLMGYGVRLGVGGTPAEPPTVHPIDRPPSTDYSTLPRYPSNPPGR